MFVAALLTAARLRKHPRPRHARREPAWSTAQRDALQPLQEEALPQAARTGPEDVTLGEIHLSQKDRYCAIPFSYVRT